MANFSNETIRAMNALEQLRHAMKEERLDAFLIPHDDMFFGENIAPGDERLQFLTKFTGSAGLAVVTQEKAALFVDGRYTLQAPAEVNTDDFDIYQIPQNMPSQWIKQTLSAGGLVGFDPWLHSLAQIRSYKKAFDLSGLIMKPLDQNLIDKIWQDRPTRNSVPIWHHDITYAGKSSQEKRQAIKEKLQEKDISAVLITDPESVSWLFNIRGSDVAHTPLVQSFAWVSAFDDDLLFIDKKKITKEIQLQFDTDVIIEEFSEIQEKLKTVSEVGSTVQVDPKNCPYALYTSLTACAVSLSEGDDPCLFPRACKNEVEINNARQAHIDDGVSLLKFMHWFKSEAPKEILDELTVVEKLHEYRAQNSNFIEDSFETIAGFGSNGAIVHYRADEKTNKKITKNNLLLLDSGAQYYNGTTDITRVFTIGTPTDEMKDRFTRVLKGMVAVTQARFPVNTTGAALDSYARQALWDVGLDYAHGTGHGVGSFLSVHEGPHGISSRSMTPLKAGMILSNEPGYYKEGEYGIRLENLILVVDDTKEGDENPMLAFETLTLAPIDRRLIDESLLTKNEKQWLETYHKQVFEKISPFIEEEEKEWLGQIL